MLPEEHGKIFAQPCGDDRCHGLMPVSAGICSFPSDIVKTTTSIIVVTLKLSCGSSRLLFEQERQGAINHGMRASWQKARKQYE